MEKNVIDKFVMERKTIFDKTRKKRFELTFQIQGEKEQKKILIIGLNPASTDIKVLDTTTTFILNNLLPMGYTTITICNLYADLCKKLKPSEIANNRENRAYLRDVLKRKFDTILIGFGNTFTGNKFVSEEKCYLKELLKDYKDCSMDLVDEAGKYARLKATHPLMAGRYYPGQWKLRPYQFEEVKKEAKKEAKEEAPGGTDKNGENQEHQPVVPAKAD